MSDKAKMKIVSDVTKEKMRIIFKDRIFSKEWKDKLKEARKGIKFSDIHKENLRISHKDKKLSEEHKKKLKERMKEDYKTGKRKSWNKGLTKDTDIRVFNNYKKENDYVSKSASKFGN